MLNILNNNTNTSNQIHTTTSNTDFHYNMPGDSIAPTWATSSRNIGEQNAWSHGTFVPSNHDGFG